MAKKLKSPSSRRWPLKNVLVSFTLAYVSLVVTTKFLESSLQLGVPASEQQNEFRRHRNSFLSTNSGRRALTSYQYHVKSARDAIRPASWTCGASDSRNNGMIQSKTNHSDVFAFIHVYKTAGSTLREFFSEYSDACHKTWVCLFKCTGAKWSEMLSGRNWRPCGIERVMQNKNGRRHQEFAFTNQKDKLFPTINNTVLENEVDIFGGHVRIGSGDGLSGQKNQQSRHPTNKAMVYTTGSSFQSSSPVRYIVFLREPMERYVSGVLYQQKLKRYKNNDKGTELTLEKVVAIVKERAREERDADRYFEKSFHYLLTPGQAEYYSDLKNNFETKAAEANQTVSSYMMERKVHSAITNLRRYNVIVGMVESMYESMNILRHVLFSEHPWPDGSAGDDESITTKESNGNEDVDKVFKKYTPPPKVRSLDDGGKMDGNGVRINDSRHGEVSTSAVVATLKQDTEFMKIFQEFVKYEVRVTDFAWKMHRLQYDQTIKR